MTVIIIMVFWYQNIIWRTDAKSHESLQALSLALHGLAFIAAADGEPVPIKEISKKLGASQAHLHKVFAKLVRCNLVSAYAARTADTFSNAPPRTSTLRPMSALRAESRCPAA
ncbi:MAG: Rrf2 family transcriptional regulator [Planctomycetota bacterium]|nr:Rrf2 family transcriptional regulator [Planctomycetota bacterium]